jgi:glucan phosphoethanolaminetransferase (alkaline phosphatase superfamily)
VTLIFLISAGVAYFMSQYGVMIDAGMFRNFAETNATEVRDLLSLKLFAYIFFSVFCPRGCCGSCRLIIVAGTVSCSAKLLSVSPRQR